MEWIADKENTFWIGMGDYIEAINYTDKRFDPSTVENKYLKNLDNVVEMQMHEFEKIMQPIIHKCIGLHTGNHEETIRLRYHVDVVKTLCKEWDVPYLAYSAFTRMKFLKNN